MVEAGPNEQSAAAAVSALQAQLQLADGNLDSLDRKAALLPAVLAALAGLFFAEKSDYTTTEVVALGLALVSGVTSVILALQALEPRPVVTGARATRVAANVHLSPAEFNQRVAGSLAIAIDQLTTVATFKASRLNYAMRFAAIAILFLALSRFVGDIHVE